jgi:aspartyl-tRNA(Asn)/glutamyl-tRNA(Gln) amidotransferase subunit C
MLKEDVVEKVAQLARLKLTEEEKETIGKQLLSILEFVNQLNEVNTEGVDVVWYGQEGTPLRRIFQKGNFPRRKLWRTHPKGKMAFLWCQKYLNFNPRVLRLKL